MTERLPICESVECQVFGSETRIYRVGSEAQNWIQMMVGEVVAVRVESCKSRAILEVKFAWDIKV